MEKAEVESPTENEHPSIARNRQSTGKITQPQTHSNEIRKSRSVHITDAACLNSLRLMFVYNALASNCTWKTDIILLLAIYF